MLSRVSILCFAASYAIVLALEISRLVFRSGVRGAFMVGWAVAGLLAHSIFLYNQAVNAAGPPLSSWRDWFLVAAWFLMIVYLYLIYCYPRNTLGVFLLPLVLGLIGTGWFVVGPEPFARQPASRIWGGLHGTSIGLAAAALLFGFATGLMYLRQERRLKDKIPPGKGLKLPSLEWLEHAAVRAMVASAVLVGIGVLTGMVLNSIDRREPEDRLRWLDPLVLGTTLMFVWLLFAVHVSYLFRRTRRGRVIAYLAVASFIILVIVLSAGMFLNSKHGGERGDVRGEREEWKIANWKLEISNCKLNDNGIMSLTVPGAVWQCSRHTPCAVFGVFAGIVQSYGRHTECAYYISGRERLLMPTTSVGMAPSTHFVLPTSHCPLRTSHFALPNLHGSLLASAFPLPPSPFLNALSSRRL